MTREDLIKHWELIEGFKNGKELEFFDRHINLWINIDNPSFDIDYEYRFKQEPKYQPFDFSDAKNLIGMYIKNDLSLNMIVSIDNDGVVFYDDHYSFRDLLESFTFIDGSICGKLC